MKKYHFFAFLHRMKFINRWGLMRNTVSENISEHSLSVAMLAHGLAVITNKLFDGNIDEGRVAVFAIYHDALEILTGDMPTPIKYHNAALRNAYKEVEKSSRLKLLSFLPGELKEAYDDIFDAEEKYKIEWQLVKAADRLSAFIKCIEEQKAGNLEFKKAGEQIFSDIKKLQLPAVKYFLENFIDSFYLTLDEQD